MSDQTVTPEILPTPLPGWKRFLMIATLIIFSAFEVWVGWTSTIPDSADRATLHGVLAVAHIVSQLLLGSLAFICALLGRPRYAIILLAANIVLCWLDTNLLDAANWKITSLWSAQETIWNLVLLPIIGLIAGRLAARNERLGLATFLICLPTLYVIVVMVGFAISVTTHGF